MKKVLEQYKDHYISSGYRAYYRAAIETLQNLIDAPTPAWVDVVIKRKEY